MPTNSSSRRTTWRSPTSPLTTPSPWPRNRRRSPAVDRRTWCNHRIGRIPSTPISGHPAIPSVQVNRPSCSVLGLEVLPLLGGRRLHRRRHLFFLWLRAPAARTPPLRRGSGGGPRPRGDRRRVGLCGLGKEGEQELPPGDVGLRRRGGLQEIEQREGNPQRRCCVPAKVAAASLLDVSLRYSPVSLLSLLSLSQFFGGFQSRCTKPKLLPSLPLSPLRR